MSADCFLFGFLISGNVEFHGVVWRINFEGEHNIIKKQGDYENRLGMTAETITKSD